MQTLFPSFSPSPSKNLTFAETLSRLAQKADGLALFGSHATPNPISDYDLLILVSDPPAQIFQMLTYIDKRMADVVFMDTATADKILQTRAPLPRQSFEGMCLQKILNGQIIHDASGRLAQLQAFAQQPPEKIWLPPTENDLYNAWFWLNHSLAHLQRMAQSDDPVYLIAVDWMLTAALSSIGRDYFRIRALNWQGEKAAIRYLQTHDPAYFELLRHCLATPDRLQKLATYRELVIRTLMGTPLWTTDSTAVYLRDGDHPANDVKTALNYWEQLFQN